MSGLTIPQVVSTQLHSMFEKDLRRSEIVDMRKVEGTKDVIVLAYPLAPPHTPGVRTSKTSSKFQACKNTQISV